MFVNLHQHSDYSLNDGYCTVEEIIARAKELGYNAAALTDHGTTTGLYNFYKQCKKAGIKPILGMEGYYCPDVTVRGGETAHILLIAKDINGLRNLYKLSTAGANQFYRKPRIGIKDLQNYHDGIICTTACIAGVLNKFPSDVKKIAEIFGDDFYLEVQPHEFEEQKEYNRRVLATSNVFGYPVIVTNDSHYCSPSDIDFHHLWVSMIGTNAYGSNDFYMMGEKEVRKRMKKEGVPDEDIDKFIHSVEEIVDKCNVEIPEGGDNYPKFDTADAERTVRDWCNEGWKSLHIRERPNWNDYVVRVKRELPVLRQCDYLNYICIIKDIIGYCKSHNILTGLGRGSVGGCCTAYLSSVTEVDSIRWGTIFERFCNVERVTPADIDVDFESDKRDEVIEYVRQKYGDVYHVRTMNRLQEKAAIKRAARALGISPTEANNISTNFQSWEGVKNEKLRDVARHFLGRLQSYGCHASAVMVFPRAPSEWCAIEKQGNEFVCATDYHDLEAQGCLKLDMLGLTQLSIVHNMADMMGVDVMRLWRDIPLIDDRTCRMLNGGKTEGCFQIESNAMKGFIKSVKVKSAEDLIPVMALCRPGPLDSGMAQDYIDRRSGKKPVKNLYPAYDEITKETYGVILYQEQVMQIAQALCGYTLGKADVLRKIIGRKVVSEMEPAMREFKEAGIANGVPEGVMNYLSDSISKSANYLFNKSHAVAYGLTSWRTAYLKANYTQYYMASLIEYNKDDKVKMAKYVACSNQMGVRVNTPTVKTPFKHTGAIEDGIYLGFDSLKYVGGTIDNIKFDDGYDGKEWIKLNANVNKRALESIVKAGALDGNRNELLQYIEWTKDNRKSKPDFEYKADPGAKSNAEMELEALGFAFSTGDTYVRDLCNGVSIFLVTVTKKKPYKTKKGKPMFFVTGLIDGVVKELVCFDKFGSDIEVGTTYIMRLSGTIIKDFSKARKRV